MAKYLTLLLFVLFIGCEMNSEQLIKTENINFENIKFNAVSKDLKFTNIEEGPEVEITKKLVRDWFNNNIKIVKKIKNVTKKLKPKSKKKRKSKN